MEAMCSSPASVAQGTVNLVSRNSGFVFPAACTWGRAAGLC